MKKFYQRYFAPDFFATSIPDIDLTTLPVEITTILLDIDNTLATHGSTSADQYAKQALQYLKEHGYRCCLVSNAKSERIKSYAQSLNCEFLEQANKPLAYKMRRFLAQNHLQPEQCLMIGDQLFTDIWAAKNLGCHSLLVRQRYSQELWNIRLKRHFERWLINRYGSTELKSSIFSK